MNSSSPDPHEPIVLLMVGDTVINPGRSGIQTVVRSLATAFGAMKAAVRPVVWNNKYNHLRPLPPNASVGLAAENLRDAPGTDKHGVGADLSIVIGF